MFVHALALCESDDVGPRTRIWAFAHVMAGARVGADCNLGDHVYVEGGAVLGDGVTVKNGVQLWAGVTVEDQAFLGPGAVFTNDSTPRAAFPKGPQGWRPTLVRRGATVGANATVVCGVTIGRWAMVGAGAVVTGDVPDHALIVGNPGRQAGWACECGLTLPGTLACACGRTYRRTEGGLTRGPDAATPTPPRSPAGHDG